MQLLINVKKIQPPPSICERDQPCLNEGQCYQTTPTTYKCTCRESWTGERCETPISSCSSDPCGPGNTCHTLKASDYKQDFVCVCDGHQSYGSSCGRNTVPNPCLAAASEREQYYPFAFSAQAYVQCNGDILYVRPCPDGLYWSQDAKTCDRIETSPAPPAPAREQSQSYQVTYGTEPPSTFARPITSFSDKNIVKTQDYQQQTDKVLVNEQSPSSFGSQVNQVFTHKQHPVFYSGFNPSSIMRRTKLVPLTQTNNYGSTQEEQKSFIPRNSYGSTQEEQKPFISRSSYGSTQEEQKPFIPRSSYGSTQEEQQPFISRNNYGAAQEQQPIFTSRSLWPSSSVLVDRNQQTQQYSQRYNQQPQISFGLQQRLRPLARVIQPEPTRNMNTRFTPSSSYRR